MTRRLVTSARRSVRPSGMQVTGCRWSGIGSRGIARATSLVWVRRRSDLRCRSQPVWALGTRGCWIGTRPPRSSWCRLVVGVGSPCRTLGGRWSTGLGPRCTRRSSVASWSPLTLPMLLRRGLVAGRSGTAGSTRWPSSPGLCRWRPRGSGWACRLSRKTLVTRSRFLRCRSEHWRRGVPATRVLLRAGGLRGVSTRPGPDETSPAVDVPGRGGRTARGCPGGGAVDAAQVWGA